MAEENDTSRGVASWLRKEAVLLALVPALGYYLVFCYERSYCGVYNIPDELVRPDLVTVLSFCAVVFAFLFSGLYLLEMWWSTPRSVQVEPGASNRKLFGLALWRVLRRWLPLILLFMLIAVGAGKHFWHEFRFSVLGVITWMTFDVSAAYEPGMGLSRLLRALAEGASCFTKGQGAFNIVRSRFGGEAMFLVSFMLVAVGGLSFLGRANALGRTRFMVPNSHTNCVVVRVYGDKCICAEFDPKTHALNNRLFILSSTDEKLGFDLTFVGPLEVTSAGIIPPVASSNLITPLASNSFLTSSRVAPIATNNFLTSPVPRKP